MSALRWHSVGDGLRSYDGMTHRIWPARAMHGFIARSALDTHGPYDTSRDAMKACEKIEADCVVVGGGTGDGL